MGEDPFIVFEVATRCNSRVYWIRVAFKKWLLAKLRFKPCRIRLNVQTLFPVDH